MLCARLHEWRFRSRVSILTILVLDASAYVSPQCPGYNLAGLWIEGWDGLQFDHSKLVSALVVGSSAMGTDGATSRLGWRFKYKFLHSPLLDNRMYEED